MKAIDLTGQKFGKLTAIEQVENDNGGHAQWLCVCDCGKECIATASTLRAKHGGKTSCGCAAFFDLTGQRFGMLTVIERIPGLQEGKVLWRCLCDCGQETRSASSNLRRGASTSCGCVRTKHLGKGTRLYRIWTGMKDRCLNPKSKYRGRYGGRGIMLCPRWVQDFSAFRDWALRSGYQEHLTIDRVENDQGYCAFNCQWLTRGENSIKARRDNAVAKAPA